MQELFFVLIVFALVPFKRGKLCFFMLLLHLIQVCLNLKKSTLETSFYILGKLTVLWNCNKLKDYIIHLHGYRIQWIPNVSSESIYSTLEETPWFSHPQLIDLSFHVSICSFWQIFICKFFVSFLKLWMSSVLYAVKAWMFYA
jgi:hypothetical protein